MSDRPSRRLGSKLDPAVVTGWVGVTALTALAGICFFQFTERAFWAPIAVLSTIAVLAGFVVSTLPRRVSQTLSPRQRRQQGQYEVLRWIMLIGPAGSVNWAVYYAPAVIFPEQEWTLRGTIVSFAAGGIALVFVPWPRRMLLPCLSFGCGVALLVAAASSGWCQTAAVMTAAFMSPAWTLLYAAAAELSEAHARRAKHRRLRQAVGMRSTLRALRARIVGCLRWRATGALTPRPTQLVQALVVQAPGAAGSLATALLFADMVGIVGAVRAAQAHLMQFEGGETHALVLGGVLCAVTAPAFRLLPEQSSVSVTWRELVQLFREPGALRVLLMAGANGATLFSWDATHPELLRRDGRYDHVGGFGLLYLIAAVIMIWLEKAFARTSKRTVAAGAAAANVIAWLVLLPGAVGLPPLGLFDPGALLADDYPASLMLETGTSVVSVATMLIAQEAVRLELRSAITVLVNVSKAIGAMVGGWCAVGAVDLFAEHWLGVLICGAAFALLQLLASCWGGRGAGARHRVRPLS